MQKYNYEILIYWSNEDQVFIAEAPELPGCMADGASQEDAFDNIQAIMREWIETADRLGSSFPEPRGG